LDKIIGDGYNEKYYPIYLRQKDHPLLLVNTLMKARGMLKGMKIENIREEVDEQR
jgi:hypothetical protein